LFLVFVVALSTKLSHYESTTVFRSLEELHSRCCMLEVVELATITDDC